MNFTKRSIEECRNVAEILHTEIMSSEVHDGIVTCSMRPSHLGSTDVGYIDEDRKKPIGRASSFEHAFEFAKIVKEIDNTYQYERTEIQVVGALLGSLLLESYAISTYNFGAVGHMAKGGAL